ncbi:ribonuclease III [Proteiniclasticum sp. QWL-01]|uniref:ribonuclease III n=1 Tax=Proteiniclasticum sp. QWL-01 TaxID=3036945 RepID=UPI0021FFBEBB|nr:ribonuclease III [Proteiniclasticum sp. QWL-01]UUM12702.1 ribonuclease III [Clostridiaceae bacterium HFYG-1003]WFF74253.1 ribonuclease III [Proteiniclasticum sp. QWL-01]
MKLNELGIRFSNEKLLTQALTHSSYANQQQGMESNEKLEFLGDAILQLCITRALYERGGSRSEGELTKIRALIVCEPSLYEVAQKWNLGRYILLSHGEEATGGRKRQSLLADAVEAVIAALYLDQGTEAADRLILEHFEDIIRRALNHEIVLDYKTRLQELLQESGEVNIHYDLVKFEGPAHRRKFFSRVAVDEITMGRGEGMSKKESEQEAARDALSKLALHREETL